MARTCIFLGQLIGSLNIKRCVFLKAGSIIGSRGPIVFQGAAFEDQDQFTTTAIETTSMSRANSITAGFMI